MSVNAMVRAALLAALTGVLAWIRIPLPFSPVPVSGQTLGVMLSGTVLGPLGGAAAQAVYLLMGAAGLPVFAGGTGGWGVLAGPGGGFLVGFVPGAWAAGCLSRRWPSRTGVLAGLVLGGMVIPYTLGVLHMARVAGLSAPAALGAGVLPFLPGDAVKVLVAAVLTRRLLRPRPG